MMTPATRECWSNLKPLPTQHSPLAFQLELTEQEYEDICFGFIPERMEDKWFIFLEENTLYIHRSWTGYCIYQLSLLREDTKYIVKNVFVNRDRTQYFWTEDRYDEKLLMFLIDTLLLGSSSPLPLSANIPAGIATELHVRHVIGAGRKAQKVPVEISILGILKWMWWWLLSLLKG